MGNDIAILFVGTIGIFLIVSTFILFAYLYQKKLFSKEKENQEIQELLKSEELKSAYALLEGQDIERERVANDLHDRMGGQLSTVKIYLDLLEESELTDRQKDLVEKLQVSAQFSIDEVRAIAHDMNNSALNYYGFQKAVEQLCSVLNETKNIQIMFHISISSEIPSKIARDVYQVIQELITNVLKHARASEIRLEITCIEDEMNVIFEDNGSGFELSEDHFGLGLKSIQLRVERYQGSFTVDSKQGQGSTFIIEIPLNHE